jgi:hypothetical protein
MASDYPAYVAQGFEDSHVEDFPPASDAHVVPGDLWFYDTTGNDANVCGADPALIAGISEIDSDAAEHLTPDGNVPLRVITGSRCILAMCSATTPAQAHVGDHYGVVTLTSGNWAVDTTETTNVRVTVKRVDIANGIFFVSILPLAMQFNAVGEALS